MLSRIKSRIGSAIDLCNERSDNHIGMPNLFLGVCMAMIFVLTILVANAASNLLH